MAPELLSKPWIKVPCDSAYCFIVIVYNYLNSGLDGDTIVKYINKSPEEKSDTHFYFTVSSKDSIEKDGHQMLLECHYWDSVPHLWGIEFHLMD